MFSELKKCLMAFKEKFLTKVFSSEGTEKNQEGGGAEPMKPDKILPFFQIAIAAVVAVICILPIAINVLKQGGL